MQLSSGDWVAIAFGTIGIGKYVMDSVFKWMGVSKEHDKSEETKLVQLRSDFEVHKAEDRMAITFIKDTMTEIKGDVFAMRKQITSLQSQIRFVASGNNTVRVTELGKDHSDG